MYRKAECMGFVRRDPGSPGLLLSRYYDFGSKFKPSSVSVGLCCLEFIHVVTYGRDAAVFTLLTFCLVADFVLLSSVIIMRCTSLSALKLFQIAFLSSSRNVIW